MLQKVEDILRKPNFITNRSWEVVGDKTCPLPIQKVGGISLAYPEIDVLAHLKYECFFDARPIKARSSHFCVCAVCSLQGISR